MKIAIHKSSWGFSGEWIQYCEKNNIPYKIVRCYDTDIIEQLEDCDILLWHHHHSDAKDVLFAKGLLFALEQSGKKVFPDFNSGWHFDDKVGQKYLLEAINAPVAKSWVFYEKKEALDWIETTSFPKVFKLRGGAGSTNVKLMRSKSEAIKMVKKAFGKGFPAYDKWNDVKEQYLKYKRGKLKFVDVLKSIRRFFVSTRFAKTVGSEKGYIYFQEFIPNNDCDYRVICIGNKVYGMQRAVRKGDFRASGSNTFIYDELPKEMVQIAFEVTKKLKATALAFDMVLENGTIPKILEISYGFGTDGSSKCNGYWNENLEFVESKIFSTDWILEECLKK